MAWSKLKRSVEEDGFETSMIGRRFKLKAEPFKQWLALVGKERLDEIADPEKAMERSVFMEILCVL